MQELLAVELHCSAGTMPKLTGQPTAKSKPPLLVAMSKESQSMVCWLVSQNLYGIAEMSEWTAIHLPSSACPCSAELQGLQHRKGPPMFSRTISEWPHARATGEEPCWNQSLGHAGQFESPLRQERPSQAFPLRVHECLAPPVLQVAQIWIRKTRDPLAVWIYPQRLQKRYSPQDYWQCSDSNTVKVPQVYDSIWMATPHLGSWCPGQKMFSHVVPIFVCVWPSSEMFSFWLYGKSRQRSE